MSTAIKDFGDLVNTRAVAARQLISTNSLLGGRIEGGDIASGSIGINAKTDIFNIGASITAILYCRAHCWTRHQRQAD